MSQLSAARVARGARRYGPRMLLDGGLAVVCYAGASLLRFGIGRLDADETAFYSEWFAVAMPFIAAAYVLGALAHNLYRRDWRYAAVPDVVAIVAAVSSASLAVLVVDLVAFPRGRPLPLSAVVTGSALVLLAFIAVRFLGRLRRFLVSGLFARGRTGVVIVGAGQTGQLLANEMIRHAEWDYQPVCFADDDPTKQGTRIHGVPVRGTIADIPTLVAAYRAPVVALAVPSASSAQVRRIVEVCQPLAVRVLTVPGMHNILRGDARATDLREVRIEDLLDRDPVSVDLDACRGYVANRTILVTGAAGSIGSELCRQVAALRPAKLVLFDNNESGVYDLALALNGLNAPASATEVVQCVGSAFDERKVDAIFARHRPDVVFHAAAYKHVPLMEEYPEEAIRTNVLGTWTVSHAASRHGVERFVLVSTDKAVNPCNVMGATKRLAELTIKELATASETVFCAVRFGNVLGSRGSVVPVFNHQIERGGPITVTHPDVTRYFMTIPEAVRLIIQAGSFARGGEVFVLDMGEQIRIIDLAAKMIRFRGLRVGDDIEITFTGLRPGEKLAEELVTGAESVTATSHPKIMRLRDGGTSPAAPIVERLRDLLADGDAAELRDALLDAVAEPPPCEPICAANGVAHR